jgi:glycosyltransferase involved in cell wall biosynthesis
VTQPPRLGLFLNMPMHETGGELSARYPHLFDFFLALAERTHETAICVPLRRADHPVPSYGPVELPANVRVVGLPHYSSAPMLVRRAHRVVPATLRVLRGEARDWDVVGAVVPSLVGNLFVRAARLRRRPVFLLVRGEKQRTVSFIMGRRLSTLPFLWALRAMERPVHRWIRRGTPAFVAGEELVDRYGAPAARLFNLYPALSRDFPVLTSPRPRDGPPGRPLRLVTVARLSREKGLADLLAAVGSLVADGRPVTLTVAGSGPDEERLVALATELGLSDRVRFAGFVPHGPALVALLDAADVFVLPSRSEGLPHSLAEAMARGLPVVATAVGGIPELLGDGSGVVVTPGDPAALARAIAALHADPPRRAALSASSLARVRRFEPDAQLADFCARLAGAYPQLSALCDRTELVPS